MSLMIKRGQPGSERGLLLDMNMRGAKVKGSEQDTKTDTDTTNANQRTN